MALGDASGSGQCSCVGDGINSRIMLVYSRHPVLQGSGGRASIVCTTVLCLLNIQQDSWFVVISTQFIYQRALGNKFFELNIK